MPRVLLVEDDPIARDAVTELLRTYDYVVETASSHRQAAAAIRRDPPDLVLFDRCISPTDIQPVLDACGRAPCRTADTLATVKALSEARGRRGAIRLAS